MKMTWQSDDADKCGGKFKKFYEDFHRAKSLIAFLSQKTASHVYLFQPPPLLFQNSNKTSVSQVMFKSFTEKVGKIIWISWCWDMFRHSDLQISWSPETETSSCLSFSWLFIRLLFTTQNIVQGFHWEGWGKLFVSFDADMHLGVLISWYPDLFISWYKNVIMWLCSGCANL